MAAGTGPSGASGELRSHRLLRQMERLPWTPSRLTQHSICGHSGPQTTQKLQREVREKHQTGTRPLRSYRRKVQSGSPKLSDNGVALLNLLAAQLKVLPNRLLIEGHTDAHPYSGNGGSPTWPLS